MGFIGNKPLQLFPEPGRQDRIRAESEDIIGQVIKMTVCIRPLPGALLAGIIENILVINTFHDGSMLSNSEQSVTASVPQGIIS